MTAVDMIAFPRLSAPSLSPDGRFLAYLKSQTDWESNRIVRRLQLIDLETGSALAVPPPATAESSDRQVWWTPDSSGFVYLSKPAASDDAQAHLWSIREQTSTQLTFHGEPLTDIVWAPDGSGFYFVAPRQQPASDTAFLENGWLIPPFEANANREIWFHDLGSGQARAVIQGPFSVRDVSLSANGHYLTYLQTPDHQLDSRQFGEVFVFNTQTLELTRWTGNSYYESIPQISPDGERLAYIASVNAAGDPYYEPKVFLQSRNGDPQRLFSGLGFEALDVRWDRASRGLYIIGNTGLRANLYYYELASGDLSQLTQGDHSIDDWIYVPTIDTHVARFEAAGTPGDFQIWEAGSSDLRRATNVYADWSNRFLMPRQEAVTWRGRRGAEIEGLLVYPIGFEPGARYPLVTITHGGPLNSSRFGSWNVSRYLPVLAAQGYLVLLPNHRGGTGYGDAFVRDMVGGYFRNAHHDVMDGIDAMIERGLADPDQLIKMGWSAGGHMVNKLITHTDRFAAASSGAGVADWLSMHGESDIRDWRRHIFGGSPWDRRPPRRQYWRDSPLKDVRKVSTPTLFFTGKNDVRVPPTQSILMYRGVRATGTPTVLYQAAGEPHNFRKPANQLFKINTELAWFARFARQSRYTPVWPDAATRETAALDVASETQLQPTNPR